jgi:hypothetical protein
MGGLGFEIYCVRNRDAVTGNAADKNKLAVSATVAVVSAW